MRFIFRVDVSKELGAGHIMRNLGIAEELINRGFDVFFMGEVHGLEWVQKKMEDIGIIFIGKNSQDFLLNSKSDILILDSYTISVNDPFIKKINWKLIVVIFDSHTPNYDCDLKIHPGFQVNWGKDEKHKILSGFEYISFRRSLLNSEKHDSLGKELNICVIGGGVDHNKFVPTISNVLSKLQGDFKVSLFTNDIDLKISDSRQNIIKIGDSFDKVIGKFNLAFSTASTTCIELISKGCAVAIAKSTDNQESNYIELGKLGVAAPIGFFGSTGWILNLKTITNLVTIPEQRSLLIERSKKFLDFHGAFRIVDHILELYKCNT